MDPLRLNLDDLAPPDKLLTFGGVDYPIRGDTPIEVMVELLRMEERIGSADEDGGGTEFIAVMAEAKERVMRLIRERTPDAPTLNLSVQDIMATLAFVAGGESVAQAVAEAIMPERDDDDPEAELERSAEAVADADPLGSAATPSRSKRSSRRSSSNSGSATAGRSAGGATSPGEPSEHSPVSATA